MITIKNLRLDPTISKQLIKEKGLQSVIGITKSGGNIMAISVVNTSSDLMRTATLILLETGADAMALLLNPKYVGSVGKKHLFVEKITPRR